MIEYKARRVQIKDIECKKSKKETLNYKTKYVNKINAKKYIDQQRNKK